MLKPSDAEQIQTGLDVGGSFQEATYQLLENNEFQGISKDWEAQWNKRFPTRPIISKTGANRDYGAISRWRETTPEQMKFLLEEMRASFLKDRMLAHCERLRMGLVKEKDLPRIKTKITPEVTRKTVERLKGQHREQMRERETDRHALLEEIRQDEKRKRGIGYKLKRFLFSVRSSVRQRPISLRH